MNNLPRKKCKSCEDKDIKSLQGEELRDYLDEVSKWSHEGIKIVREFTFKNFLESMQFIERVADIAEEEGHHPDIHISYNKVRLELYTHSISGLSENDFIVASKIDLI